MPKIVAQKTDWIKLGYQRFSEQGIAGIVIEELARKLKCNKSSFYWHFKTKKDFVNELIDHWIKTETEQVIRQAEKATTPKAKYNTFLAIAFKNNPYLEFIFFLKRYAVKHPDIQEIIDEVDQRRLDFTTQLFEDNGYAKKEAQIKARLFYNYLIGYHEMIKNKSQNDDYLTEVKADLKHFLNL